MLCTSMFFGLRKIVVVIVVILKSCFCVIVTMINVLFSSFICQLQVRNSIVKRLKVREELWTGVHRLRGHWGWTPTGLLDLYQPRKKNLEGTFLLTFFARFLTSKFRPRRCLFLHFWVFALKIKRCNFPNFFKYLNFRTKNQKEEFSQFFQKFEFSRQKSKSTIFAIFEIFEFFQR